jgi:hypothetical protein
MRWIPIPIGGGPADAAKRIALLHVDRAGLPAIGKVCPGEVEPLLGPRLVPRRAVAQMQKRHRALDPFGESRCDLRSAPQLGTKLDRKMTQGPAKPVLPFEALERLARLVAEHQIPPAGGRVFEGRGAPRRSRPIDERECRPGRLDLKDALAQGMVATIIQSTAASRPIRAAMNWLTRVETVLDMSPKRAAARQFKLRSDHQTPAILSSSEPESP